ncbi:SGT1 protein-domain-containing protein [Colletotrichum navitas]|uniref:SGT1 protein-domain-containing protein n=1 Tax=Colletotrichum navitas TaxID=681940 RepID=A0AAD8PT74_9PEZI|nr:SGT1 protein-domain-containing protein [Colletotrichum navitas]KAK1580264.1 SGT1 protein-domain-containing protein [Colletotrichum navitas]
MTEPQSERPVGNSSDGSKVGNTQSLPENCIWYCIFLVDPNTQNNHKNHLSHLEDLRKSALQLTTRLTSDYIWQKGTFILDVVTEQGLTFLRGTTDYGDSIEDEWLVVYILRELSKSHPNVWVRVFDSDGEFLLIEAANVLPKWLSPETDQNRVWINNGCLHIIPQLPDESLNFKLLTLPDAVNIIKSSPDKLVHSDFIEAEAFYRLEKYPDQIQKSLHHSLVTVPRRLAHVLHQSPKAVAPAVESFYLRDALDLKALFSQKTDLHFPPKDLVTLSVKFTRVLFAQLKSQRFEPPGSWATVIQEAKGAEQARLEMGMKLTCGFEIMLNNIKNTDNREAREACIVVEELQEDGDSVLPGDDEINSWRDAHLEDDESWMDINYADFESELAGRRGGERMGSNPGFGDATTQADLRKIVSRFEAFLNDDSAGLDGAEVDEMDIDDDESDEDDEDEDKAISFDEAEFSRMMREMMGLAPAESSTTSVPNEPDATATRTARPAPGESIKEKESEDEELRKLSAQFEAELNAHGALRLNQSRNDVSILKGMGEGGKAAVGGRTIAVTADHRATDDYDDDSGDDGEVDIDYNLAKNLLESFKGQVGMPGPAGNILGMMGLQLPRDEDMSDSEGSKI